MYRLVRVKDGVVLRSNEPELWPLVNGCRKKDGSRYTKKEAAEMGDGSIVYKMMGVTKVVPIIDVDINSTRKGTSFRKAYAETAVPYRIEEYHV